MHRQEFENRTRVKRLQLLKENLRLSHITEGADDIRKICEEYVDIFKLPGDSLTATTAAEHTIPTPTIPKGRAITLRNYRLPEAQCEEVKRQVSQMLEEDIITTSNSGWNFPLLVVPKKLDASGKRKWRIELGHVVTAEGVKPDKEKIKAVTDFPIPQSQKDIKSFLGLAGYYRKFIVDFSSFARPLTDLLKKENEWTWTEKEQTSFELLKSKLTKAPLLQYPDFSKPFILTTDATGYAIGAILSQGKLGQDKPIAYASRTLNKAELNYATVEKELLAIVWACKHFRPYLLGRKFQIVTDHKGLTWIFNVKDPSSRLMRWKLLLEEHDYEIQYRAGQRNCNADSLSRYPTQCLNINAEEIMMTENKKKFYDIFKRVCKLFKIDKICTTAYHPESNGALERTHKTLTNYFRCFCDMKLNNWDEWLPFACFTYNTTPHSVTKFTPYEVLFGRIANIPGKLQRKTQPLYNFEDIVMDIKQKMQSCQQMAREKLIKFKESQREKVSFSNHEFQVNDLVLLRVENRQKLGSLWRGPFEIKKIQGSNAVIQEVGKRKHQEVHINRLKPYFSSIAGKRNGTV
ncbi:hypothetical protein B7P43_G18013 [Cryptotermes secundus]|uniref:Integrase catalytic domain-containing protein n=1 Tax=Cryptotermes secundus TaxID=105785 RepID=A0A2J7RQN2_9NEOP|nr:hypothetical protein B7P43_G18013 [Cryptotermes secundus]